MVTTHDHSESAERLREPMHAHHTEHHIDRYSFSVPDAVAKGELRPLRNPASDE